MYKIGTQFEYYADKNGRVNTIIDILTTKNNQGDVVNISYIAENECLGQKVKGEFRGAGIARSKIIYLP